MSKFQFTVWVNKEQEIDGLVDLLERFGCNVVDHKVGNGAYDLFAFAINPLELLSNAKKVSEESIDIPAMSIKVDAQHNLVIIDRKE